MPRIFVSYRRNSSEAITWRLVDRLIAHFGKESVFVDIEIPIGVDYRSFVDQALTEYDIMIAVVGSAWSGLSKRSRTDIQHEDDSVRLEIESALRREVLVIPVLVDDATMPRADDLPDSLKDFAYRHAFVVTSGRDFHTQVDRLIRLINREALAAPASELSVGAAAEAAIPKASYDPPPLAGASPPPPPPRLYVESLLARIGRFFREPLATRPTHNRGSATKIKSAPADFLVTAPNPIQASRNFVVEVWAAPSGERSAMLEQAMEGGRMFKRGGRSRIILDRNTIITLILQLPDFEISEPIQTMNWIGDIRNVGFAVKAPASLSPGVYSGFIKLMHGQLSFASISFDLDVVSADGRQFDERSRPLETHFERIKRAFASYASEDRSEVLRRVQGIQALGTDVFLDIVKLRSGETWQEALYREIEASDRFFLFWSRSAARSSWVEREWRYALQRRGVDFISPLALEDPRFAAPPVELQSKHFNDALLAFIKAEDAYRDDAK